MQKSQKHSLQSATTAGSVTIQRRGTIQTFSSRIPEGPDTKATSAVCARSVHQPCHETRFCSRLRTSFPQLPGPPAATGLTESLPGASLPAVRPGSCIHSRRVYTILGIAFYAAILKKKQGLCAKRIRTDRNDAQQELLGGFVGYASWYSVWGSGTSVRSPRDLSCSSSSLILSPTYPEASRSSSISVM